MTCQDTKLIRRLWVALSIFIMVWGGFEVASRYFSAKIPLSDSGWLMFDQKRRIASHINPQKPVGLILGDSYAAHGVYSDLLQARLQGAGRPVTVVNLGAQHLGWPGIQELLETASASRHPDWVVLVINPKNFNKTYLTHTVQEQASDDTPYHQRCVWQPPTQPLEKLRCSLESHSYFIRFLPALQAEMASIPKIWSDPEKPSLHNAPQIEVSQTGWSAAARVALPRDIAQHFQPEKRRQLMQKEAQLSRFQFTPRGLEPMTAFCKNHHIPLILLWLPYHPSEEKLYTSLGWKNPEQLSHDLQTYSHQNQLGFLDLHKRDPELSHYYNGDHLNVLGSIPATEALAGYLKQVLP